MAMDSQTVRETLRTINQTWLEGRPQDMESLIHPEIVFVIPGFAGRMTGWPALLAGFDEFCRSSRIVSFDDGGIDVDEVGDAAVASFHFEMVYEHAGASTLATGRDLWVFTRTARGWQAVWRTMLDLSEQPA
jgi:ketosteroid isomerase-like protein